MSHKSDVLSKIRAIKAEVLALQATHGVVVGGTSTVVGGSWSDADKAEVDAALGDLSKAIGKPNPGFPM